MARNNHSPLQALIRVIRVLGKAVTTWHAEKKSLAPNAEQTDAPQVASPPGTQPARIKTKPRKPRPRAVAPKVDARPTTPNCPHCKKPMQIKIARTGNNAGEFWGCVAYPKCRGIRPIFKQQ